MPCRACRCPSFQPPDWDPHRHRVPRHGRHAARPALRQLCSGWRSCRSAGRRCTALDAGRGAGGTAAAVRCLARHARVVLRRPLERRARFRHRGPEGELRAQIRFLPGALQFLDRLRRHGKRCLLTTNAHPTAWRSRTARPGLGAHFDALVSSHEFGVPKESPEFWQRLAERHDVEPETARCSSTTARQCCMPRETAGVAGYTRCCSRTRPSRRTRRCPAFPGVGWRTSLTCSRPS